MEYENINLLFSDDDSDIDSSDDENSDDCDSPYEYDRLNNPWDRFY